jgi:hypothetical protein
MKEFVVGPIFYSRSTLSIGKLLGLITKVRESGKYEVPINFAYWHWKISTRKYLRLKTPYKILLKILDPSLEVSV